MIHHRSSDERGAIAVWAAVGLLAFMIVIGLGVDFAGHARAEQQARAVAAEAARSGGQQLQLDDGTISPTTVSASAASERYAQDAGYDATVTVSGAGVSVVLRDQYETSFLGIIGIYRLPVEASASATTQGTLGDS